MLNWIKKNWKHVLIWGLLPISIIIIFIIFFIGKSKPNTSPIIKELDSQLKEDKIRIENENKSIDIKIDNKKKENDKNNQEIVKINQNINDDDKIKDENMKKLQELDEEEKKVNELIAKEQNEINLLQQPKKMGGLPNDRRFKLK